MAQILLVESQQVVGERLKTVLVEEGFEVLWTHSLESAKQHLGQIAPDLVLLDLDLPEGNGLELLPLLRDAAPFARRIVLSTAPTTEDRISGLDVGADDYIAKPFVLAELIARIRAQLRRLNETVDREILIGPLSIYPLSRVARLNGSLLILAPREFDLLLLLARHCPEPVVRDTIALAIWKTGTRTTTTDNAIDVHIARLRKKVNLPDSAPLLLTLRGVGFKLVEPA